ncbi:MAG TPA: hypothetical protein DEQ14_10280 [Treponema sp.]|nr:hypothetical protein [Treponema sp.]
MSNVSVDITSYVEIRNIGLKALQEALGPVGMARFIQQYENGEGDYTKEKYDQADVPLQELRDMLIDKGVHAGAPDAKSCL